MKRVNCAVLGLCSMILMACSEQPQLDSAQAIDALRTLNANQNAQSVATPWPYTEEYLARRYDIYEHIDAASLSDEQRATLGYLVTEQRYVERYLPFTLNTTLEWRSIGSDESLQTELAQWLGFVQAKLTEAAQSNIRLNIKEKEHLLSQLNALGEMTVIAPLSEAVASLSDYLNSYRVRNKLGMSQLPNGKEWYQVKLNYYSSATHSPIQWITKLSDQLAQVSGLDVGSESVASILPHSLRNQAQLGLDWRQQFKNYKSLVAERSLTDSQKAMVLVWMQVDLGIHSQLWSEEMAMQVMAKAKLSAVQQDAMLTYVLSHPGQSLIYAHAVF